MLVEHPHEHLAQHVVAHQLAEAYGTERVSGMSAKAGSNHAPVA